MNKPAKILGIIGGGQLGRMSALAAARLGIATHIYTPEESSPASRVAARTFIGSYDDKAALRTFAKTVDVITYEFENIPSNSLELLNKLKPVLPGIDILEISQHRPTEKRFLNDCNISTAKWAQVRKSKDVDKILEELGLTTCILKTSRFGYDGRGQVRYNVEDNIEKVWNDLNSDDNIIEEVIDFSIELSVIVARDALGKTVIYDPVQNEHKNHILHKTNAPAQIPTETINKIKSYVRKITKHIDFIGVLAIEFFLKHDGSLIANEIAPRPHNSGHWTMDACAVSQFENHVRTVCGLPVGPARRHSNAVMLNLIGDDIDLAKNYLEKSNACIHLYGKAGTRPGRKMGHINLLSPLK